MPNIVIETIQLPNPASQDQQTNAWGLMMVRQIVEVFQQHGRRINTSVDIDGGLGMANPLVLAPFTIATLPPAGDWERGIIFVSDGIAGEKFRGSDGTTWVNLG